MLNKYICIVDIFKYLILEKKCNFEKKEEKYLNYII